MLHLTDVAPVAPQHDYITTGGLVLIALIGAVGAILSALIERSRREAVRSTKASKAAQGAAESADKHAKPIGNGYAGRTEQALGRIERDLGGIRQEMRTERDERMALAEQLRDHLKESRAS